MSTQSREPRQYMPPLAFEGPVGDVRQAILELLRETPRVAVFVEEPEYVRAEFTTFVFRFVDDVEFLIDPGERIIHFRSASRIGRSDLGTNRRRMSRICRELARRPSIFLDARPENE